MVWRELRLAADGALVVESKHEGSALAVSTESSLPPRARVRATATWADGDGGQNDLVFSYRGKNAF